MVVRANTGDDFSNATSGVTVPCFAHVGIVEAESPPLARDGKPIDGGLLQIVMEVLQATAPDQVGRKATYTFFYPKPDARDGGKWNQKKHDRFLLAVGMIREDQTGQTVEYDEKALIGRQMVVEFATENDKHGKQKSWCSIPFAQFFHVDDAEVANHPKNEKMIACIPQSLRKISGKQDPPGAGSAGSPASPKKDHPKFDPSNLKL